MDNSRRKPGPWSPFRSVRWRILAAGIAILVIAGCDRPSGVPAPPDARQRPLDNDTLRAGFDPANPRTVALVAWLKRKGVTLEYRASESGSGDWAVTHPRTSREYDVIFKIRAFPDWASEEQMRAAVMETNLAFLLNAPAHLAISRGGCTGTHPAAVLPRSDDELPKVNGIPVTEAVGQWFRQY